MADTILTNYADFGATYDGEDIQFSTNSVETTLVEGLTATKTASKEVWVNGPLLYTIAVTNSTENTLTNVQFTDTLDPSVITLDTTYGVRVNGTATTYNFAAGVLSLTIAEIEVGATVTITFQVLRV